MSQTRQHVNHYLVAAQARRRPLAWVLVCHPKDRQAALDQVRRIKTGASKAYQAGGYEAHHDRDTQGEPRVWARWIGADE